jgi:hypothetical protein
VHVNFFTNITAEFVKLDIRIFCFIPEVKTIFYTDMCWQIWRMFENKEQNFGDLKYKMVKGVLLNI